MERLRPAISALAILAAAFLIPGEPLPVGAQSPDLCATAATASNATASAQLVSETPGKPHQHSAPKYRDALWAHRARPAISRAAAAAGRTYDSGEIAIVEDAGDLLIRPHPYDLSDSGLRFSPNAAGGYDVARVTYGFRQPLGSALALDDDDGREEALGFAFTFFGHRYDRVFVNSDGNVTFDERDVASSERSVTRLLTGAPRIAPLFADLNPAAGGRVLISSSVAAYTVTWCAVPEYGTQRAATTQVTVLPTGVIEIQSSGQTTVADAIVGISPGRDAAFAPIDLSAAGVAGDAGQAIGERFTTRSELDTVSTLRRFFGVFPDEFDNVVMFTDSSVLTSGTFAYELTVANDIQGLNIELFDASEEWGSLGALQSLVMMDRLGKYPDDPRQIFLGTNSTLSVLGQEFGHRWAAFLTFRDAGGRESRQLLGRDDAHWSFFFDSDASVMEGNDIQDLGDGRFRTVAATTRYSLLDQYAMGLIDRAGVPPLFVVENPTDVTPPRGPSSEPEVGVTFSGARRDLTIDDIIASAGARVPSAAESKRAYRQGFMYITSPGRGLTAAEVDKVDRIRVAWDQFLSAATDSRMIVDTRLRTGTR